jgi:hypothetical protein
MDPTHDSRPELDGRPPVTTRSHSFARSARAVAIHLARLLWPAVAYLWATFLDLLYAARFGLLWRSRRKFPNRARDLDTQVAILQASRSGRWSSWKALPAGRRMEVRCAAALLAAAAILGLRAHLTGRGSTAELAAHQPRTAHSPSAQSPGGAASTSSTSSTSSTPSALDQAHLDAEHFKEYRKQAAPGQWVIYGVEPVEIARANRAAVQAQLKAIQADTQAAWQKTAGLNDRVSRAQSLRAELLREHAFQGALADADEAIKAAQAGEDDARAAYEKLNHRRDSLQAADVAAGNALNSAMNPVAGSVLTRGDVYAWDDFKVTSPAVIKDGGRYRMWYVGCHFVSEEYTCGIGHAQSRDGIQWQKSPEPVLTIDDRAVSQDLASIAVVRTDDEFLLWYAIDANPLDGNDCATLYLATSKDGLAWKPQGLVLSGNCWENAHLWPSAFADGKTLHLWYSDYGSTDDGLLTHLVSADGKEWQPAGSTDLGTLGLDPRRMWVTRDADGYRALFARPDRRGYFGQLQSPDGSSWLLAGDAPTPPDRTAFPRFTGGDDGGPVAPASITESDGTSIWFAVPNSSDGSERIAMAFQKEAQR